MTELPNLAKLIAEYGILIILAGIFILFSWRQNKQVSARVEKIQEAFYESTSKFQDLAFNAVAEAIKGQKKKEFEEIKDSEEEMTKKNDRQVLIMKQALLSSGANRVLYFEYHNGGQGHTGDHFQRMSCTNEVLKSGVAPTQSRYRDTFRSSFRFIYEGLQRSNHIEVYDIEELRESDPGSYDIFHSDGSRALFVHSIRSLGGGVVGYVLFSFVTPQTDKNLVEIISTAAYHLEGANSYEGYKQ